MNDEIRDLQPKALWHNFADLNEVPRASKKEDRVIEFIKNFGENLGLDTQVDETGNVVIRKPATTGLEDRKTIVLQSHLDMVHQKNNDTKFDFDTQGIKMYVDGDWVKAEGTTLGADNGLGVATIMAILQSDDIQHPAIEALFTIDEETGMTGAKGLSPELLDGDILLNLDTEEDDEIGIGCAGGIDITALREYEEENIPDNSVGYKIVVKGLQGGHSGMDIIKGLANANKLMARLLYTAYRDFGLRVSELQGGGLRNAIPRESEAFVVVDKEDTNFFVQQMLMWIDEIKKEYASLEPNMDIGISEAEINGKLMKVEDQMEIIKAIASAHNGVYRMSPEIEGLVEASNNIANVVVANGKAKIKCLTRSSVESTRSDLAHSLQASFELAKFKVKQSGEYPGWAPNPASEILKVLDEIYQKQHGEKAHIAACHAGLECGIIGNHYPDMDMISFGPTIKGAHSPDERASISSTQKFWDFTLEILKNIPKK
ncbi:aminoacyl-histidine dipeptidase [Zunongwangia profunda]|uniref:Cytosol non-specific dipeptidase n=2 Tax=Zunongwangia profunda TaxID=398743 RepID=D5BLQ2_ZUNPS|nr:aminoacyl-histidine dipeptidase [Zunongwangia profunda]ADF52018.1 aminoacyl-histidine dipeptidase [Zunongwangia profunda SM-A87]MAS70116.1 aminoacyl-histidine dipeptidase [Zunongwangia sp.]HCV80521.1 aminoacyl-histidine dipeptidase [Zunongwangia profunda]|tara:strand:+ start:968 stop:2428 length:1461 start_codon:yes stop_codon:yes gene_type:complete